MFNASVGVPVTVTASAKLTVIGTVGPALYEAVRGDEVTFVTVGAVVSTTMFFALASAPAVPLPVWTVSIGIDRCEVADRRAVQVERVRGRRVEKG